MLVVSCLTVSNVCYADGSWWWKCGIFSQQTVVNGRHKILSTSGFVCSLWVGTWTQVSTSGSLLPEDAAATFCEENMAASLGWNWSSSKALSCFCLRSSQFCCELFLFDHICNVCSMLISMSISVIFCGLLYGVILLMLWAYESWFKWGGIRSVSRLLVNQVIKTAGWFPCLSWCLDIGQQEGLLADCKISYSRIIFILWISALGYLA